MNEIDLGAVRVALTEVPTGASQPAAQVDMRNISNESEATASGLSKPAFIPADLTFADGTLVRSPVSMVIATYHDPKAGRSVTIAQTPLSSLKVSDGKKASIFAPGVDLEPIEINGKAAVRVTISTQADWRGSRHSLVWIGGDHVFQLNGRGTSDSELLEIAASV